jgi:hypothetical protein
VALEKADTLADIQSLERILQTQKFPKDWDYKFGDKKGQEPEAEEATEMVQGMETEAS